VHAGYAVAVIRRFTGFSFDDHSAAVKFYSSNTVSYCVQCVVAFFMMELSPITIQEHLVCVAFSFSSDCTHIQKSRWLYDGKWTYLS
jgi:hypothetical protein